MFSSDGLLGELKKALAERILNAEMDHHLAEANQDEVSEGEKAGNHRNRYSKNVNRRAILTRLGVESASKIDHPVPCAALPVDAVTWGAVLGNNWQDTPPAAGAWRVDQRDCAGSGAIAQHCQAGVAVRGGGS